MALRANRPNTGAVKSGAPAAGVGAAAKSNVGAAAAPAVNTQANDAAPQENTAAQSTAMVATNTQAVSAAKPGALNDLNAGILDNIEGLGNAGNYVTMDGSEFLYKALEQTVPSIDLIVNYGKRYYQWVEDDGENKTFHDSDTKLDDRYKLKFEIHWEEENEEGEVSEAQFHMPTASAMRFIDYVKGLAKAGYGIGQVVTRMTISRQVRKGSTDRYSRAEFTMVGIVKGEEVEYIENGFTTVGKK